MRVAINGFGRIGRMVFRANLMRAEQGKEPLDIVAINDLGDPKQTAHLLKYDSTYGILPMTVEGRDDALIVDGKEFKLVQNRNPEELPWGELDIDVVIECTGVFRTREGAGKHIKAGAKKVVISAPAKDEIDLTVVMGVNHEDYQAENHHIISNASCTTNCLGPVAKVIQDTFGIKRGLMTTIHAYTNDQNIQDNDHKDMRRARAAALNIIPTSTGAAKAIGQVLPELEGKLDGMAMRVPVPVVSLVDATFELEKDTTAEEINAAIKAAADGPLKGILGVTEAEMVSSDFKGDSRSSIFDSYETKVIDGNMAKILSWYDNEWGYSCRCLDLVEYMAEQA
ncbi:type I glyceraldehyde-3-phosphate dehydrogenase [Candidatus Peregrinibacteria bacterium]|jgi:glyceraldehyde 3-phosphate dehydrogenase|nr:type I glyceraldehyde-3-phosphate dehydrogenase [Candidatus Peregrinibacteria bacterium]MBT4632090.1 type I glyceraldehyde-3-phosphate dehydrogenase [Candidatus Peregrinibacteria bacterium]MBT5516604.1 type I glyceraldehyde-3-phosphate dehydrogenase [Candidatus Peregrinibacteria bacterium]MBT5823508.1 type I glyceraldehyde-3-phosphate dehydrogenase [Candidatus Peregrinibacteria bacterium]